MKTYPFSFRHEQATVAQKILGVSVQPLSVFCLLPSDVEFVFCLLTSDRSGFSEAKLIPHHADIVVPDWTSPFRGPPWPGLEL